MILKVWDESGGWVYFDRIERLSMFYHDPLKDGEDHDYEGGIYVKTLKERFKVATINRTWGHCEEGEFVEVVFNEGYLLSDDGQTIERI